MQCAEVGDGNPASADQAADKHPEGAVTCSDPLVSENRALGESSGQAASWGAIEGVAESNSLRARILSATSLMASLVGF